jgi:tetratricopeptide (TPR) repeat protein
MFKPVQKMTHKPVYLVAGILFVAGAALVAGILVFGALTGEWPGGVGAAFHRVKNYIAFAALGDKPSFYYLIGEKNGQEIRLTEKDSFEVTYRDEFVIKGIATDDLFGSKTTVDVEGAGVGNDLGRLLKGIELVDKTARSSDGRPYRIMIRYNEVPIAAIPIVVTITAQDWLRYARATEDLSARIRYLRQAIALNREDIPVRKMLVASYEKAGMKAEAAAQLAEIASMERHGPAAAERPAAQAMVETGAGAAGASSFAQKGLAYSRARDWKNAIASYQEALKLEPDNGQIRYKLGEAYERSDQTGEAIEQYGMVLAKNPRADYAMVALADVSLRVGRYDEAIKWYGELIKQKPRKASLYGNLGLAYGGKGMAGEEIKQYKKALTLDPKNTVILFNLGAAYEKGKNDQEAAKAYRRILKLKPGDADAATRLAGLAFKSGNYTEAIKGYEQAVKKSGNKAAIYANLGYAYGEKKDYRKSAEYYEKALKSGNKDPKVKTNLAYARDQIKAGKTGGAVKGRAAEEVAATGTPAAGKKSTNRQIDRYVKQKKYNLAIAEYRKIIRKDPKNPRYHEGLGDVYGLAGDTNRQIESYQRSLKYGKANDGVYTRLGAAYEKKGRLKDALAAYSRAYELNPDSAAAGRRMTQLKIKMLQEKHRGEEKEASDR